MPGWATSSMPAKRDRLRGGAAAVDVSPCSLLAASSSLGVAAAVGPGSPQGSVCSWGSPPGAGVAAGGSGAALRGCRIPSLGRGGTSVSRSAAHGAEASGRTEGWGLFGDGRPLHRASNWRRSWGKRGGRGENQLLGQQQGGGKEFLPLCDTWNRSRGAGSEGCHQGRGTARSLGAPRAGMGPRGHRGGHLGGSVGHGAGAALAELLQVLLRRGEDLVEGQQVGAHEGRDGAHGALRGGES